MVNSSSNAEELKTGADGYRKAEIMENYTKIIQSIYRKLYEPTDTVRSVKDRPPARMMTLIAGRGHKGGAFFTLKFF